MRSKQIFSVLVIIISLSGCREEMVAEEENPFSGLWSLYIMEQQNAETGEWSEWRDGMQGYILYDDKDNMSVHLTKKGYQNTDLRFPNFIDTVSVEALKHLTGSYVYFAKYTVNEEEKVVQHARFSHSNPGDWNVVVRRRFTFSGDTLILAPLEEQNSGLRLKWIKSSGN
jgi:hypothetical protein